LRRKAGAYLIGHEKGTNSIATRLQIDRVLSHIEISESATTNHPAGTQCTAARPSTTSMTVMQNNHFCG
jgi:hypothetical protein